MPEECGTMPGVLQSFRTLPDSLVTPAEFLSDNGRGGQSAHTHNADEQKDNGHAQPGSTPPATAGNMLDARIPTWFTEH